MYFIPTTPAPQAALLSLWVALKLDGGRREPPSNLPGPGLVRGSGLAISPEPTRPLSNCRQGFSSLGWGKGWLKWPRLSAQPRVKAAVLQFTRLGQSLGGCRAEPGGVQGSG